MIYFKSYERINLTKDYSFMDAIANLLLKICFSNEWSFIPNDNVINKNCRHWNDKKWKFWEKHTPRHQKFTVSACFLGNTITGPKIIEKLHFRLLQLVFISSKKHYKNFALLLSPQANSSFSVCISTRNKIAV